MTENPKTLLLKGADGKYHKYVKIDEPPLPLVFAELSAATNERVRIVILEEEKPDE